MVKRFVAVVSVAAALVALPASAALADPPLPGGQCDGVVDTGCRDHQCQPDELDCGLIPPCFLWVLGTCYL